MNKARLTALCHTIREENGLTFNSVITSFTLSSKSRNEHDRDLFLSLSSDQLGFEKAKDSSRSFDMLFSAVFLTLDYCDGTQYQIAGEKARTALINGGLTSVPLLDLLTSKGSGGSSHEQNTHMGWNYQYDMLLIQKKVVNEKTVTH
ncbi:MAG: hypothetical protein RBR15_11955 [Sphaerochaeta sp.]|nr:hypothetical protein [Sphaerochaeta sp.]